MSTVIVKAAIAAGVAGLVAASPAHAAPVFGGATSNAHPIVIRSDAKTKKLVSAVIAWSARCKSDSVWEDSGTVTAAKPDPGFSPGREDLLMARNKGGRFSGVQLSSGSTGDMSAASIVRISGRLRAKAATGTLTASVTIVDADGKVQDACETGTVRWSATRAPGRVFGGATSQEQPIVVRLDRSRRKVGDLMFAWGSQSCAPPAYLSFGESFGNFPISNRRFGDSFSQDFPMDGGGKRTFSYDVAGGVTRKAAKGTLRVRVHQVDGAGAEQLSCDTGAISWRALTG